MAKPTPVIVNVTVKVTNQKAVRALNVLLRNLESLAEDFEYRDDIKQSVKAANYLTRHLTVVSENDSQSAFCSIEPE